MKNNHSYITLLILTFSILIGCNSIPSDYSESSAQPNIFPDYTDITIPANIAPLNFQINNTGDNFIVEISNSKESNILLKSKDGKICIPENKWKKLLTEDSGGSLSCVIFRKNKNEWEKLPPYTLEIAEEEIDKYVSFRKITSANILWKEMGIYQRSLENFDLSPIMTNTITDHNCMNCHTYNQGNPDEMMFHMRAQHGGTFIRKGNENRFVNTKSDHTRGAGAYASWHPDGHIIAFSVNQVKQRFLSKMGNNLIVYDLRSDIVLYDLDKNSITRPKVLSSASLENLPSWSPKGDKLFYIQADELKDTANFFDTKYELMSIDYDKNTRSFSNIDTLIRFADLNKSITFPRVSPNNKYLSFIGLDFGYFSINNKEADVFLYDIEKQEIKETNINSTSTESYPSWSTNGAWLMFVSKRGDDNLSQLWFAHVDENGSTSKPFLLPQQDPAFYESYLYNYNRPEFLAKKSNLKPRKIYTLVKNGTQETEFNLKESVSISSGATAPANKQEGFYQFD